MLPGFPKQLFICRLRLFSPYAYDLCTHKPWITSPNHTSPLHPLNSLGRSSFGVQSQLAEFVMQTGFKQSNRPTKPGGKHGVVLALNNEKCIPFVIDLKGSSNLCHFRGNCLVELPPFFSPGQPEVYMWSSSISVCINQSAIRQI